MKLQGFCFFVIIACLTFLSVDSLREGECEVCLKMMELFENKAKEAKASSNLDFEEVYRNVCKSERKNKKHNRFCFYVGGNPDSATNIMRMISDPMKMGVPGSRICERLKKADLSICELRYDKKIEVNETVDLTKYRIKDLKKILKDWGQKCKGCTEKSDFIRLIRKLAPDFDPTFSSSEKDEL